MAMYRFLFSDRLFTGIVLFLLVYCIAYAIIFWYFHFWTQKKLKSDSPFIKGQQEVTFTILIPVRNDADLLKELLQQLLQQMEALHCTVPIIVVDDHSYPPLTLSDGRLINCRLVSSPQDISGKKGALKLGIREAQTEWIVTLDADVQLHDKWLDQVKYHCTTSKADMLVLPVAFYTGNTLIEQFSALEMCGLQYITTATIAAGTPVMCNGANLAFRKKAWEEVQSQVQGTKFISGDDTLLMHALHQNKPGSITRVSEKSAGVITKSPVHWQEFIRQRLRWAAKNTQAPGRTSLWWSIPVILSWSIIIILMIGLMTGQTRWILGGLSAWCVKGILEYVFLEKAVFLDGRMELLKKFPLMACISTIYIVIVSGLVLLGGRFVWKGRVHQK